MNNEYKNEVTILIQYQACCLFIFEGFPIL